MYWDDGVLYQRQKWPLARRHPWHLELCKGPKQINFQKEIQTAFQNQNHFSFWEAVIWWFDMKLSYFFTFPTPVHCHFLEDPPVCTTFPHSSPQQLYVVCGWLESWCQVPRSQNQMRSSLKSSGTPSSCLQGAEHNFKIPSEDRNWPQIHCKIVFNIFQHHFFHCYAECRIILGGHGLVQLARSIPTMLKYTATQSQLDM